MIIRDYQINDEQLTKIAKDKAVTNIWFKALLEGYLISPSMFLKEIEVQGYKTVKKTISSFLKILSSIRMEWL